VAIVTGGASGIGEAMSKALAQQGCHVVVADLQAERAETVAAQIRAAGGQATGTPLDVTDYAAVKRLIEDTVGAHARLDYLFNNAGISVNGEVRDYRLEDWDRVFDVNVRGVTNGIQAAYPIMIRQGYGHIVNTASMAGLVPSPMCVSYTASKHAVVGLSLALRIEAETLGVRVSVLCPGMVRTAILDGGKSGKMLKPVSPERWQSHWERYRPMAPEQFAPRALQGVAKNQAVIVVPWWWKLAWRLNRFSLLLGQMLARKFFRDTQKVFEESRTAPGRSTEIH
jgi:NAD(P)-dependent dehydrogenase (short-subunit alcohol dehydrogenase family)